ncbi:MAG: CHAD domain-containing protein, partial [Acidobacteriota bacterium]
MYSLKSTFDQLWLEFSHAVAACRVDVRKSHVHDLRTGSRRMEALLQKTREDHPSATELHQHTTRALRQLKKLRRLAGPIRDIDVHLRLLRRLPQAEPRAVPHAEIDALQNKLNRNRLKLAAQLREYLDRKELKLEGTFESIATDLKTLKLPSPTPLTTARKWLRRSAVRIAKPTEKNLHDLRKQTKAARYLVALQPGSATARALVDKLRRVQTAIGNWHDRQLLETTATRILGHDASLPAALKTSTYLDRALRLAQKT